MTDVRLAAVVVLAAGEGTRMRSATPKVLHPLCGRTMLGHVLAAVESLSPQRTLVVVGHGREQVAKTLPPGVEPVVQERQDGTGHAVRVALEAAPDADGTVLVLAGDTPLITIETLTTLLDTHHAEGADATVLSAVVADPTGLGRVVRDGGGRVARIVEHRDASDAERAITEVNTSIYAFAAAPLRAALTRLSTDNAQGEQYLTDVIGAYVGEQRPVCAVSVADPMEAAGVNDRVQLAAVRRAFRDRLLAHWMREGVTVVDPQTTWLGVGVRLEPDVVLHQNTQLHGRTAIERGAEVGPDCTLRDVVVGAGARVVKSHCEDAEIGPDAIVGPYSYLRPGAVLRRGAKVGAFVEVKASEIGERSKVPHLSYIGDATIGARSNVGAATVVVNYDGVAKHRTVVGEDVRIGSDTMLVAPVEVGDGAYTAAGSVITDDVPPGALAVARGQQRNIEGWVERRRPGSPAAEAAARARAAADGGDDAVHSGQDEERSDT